MHRRSLWKRAYSEVRSRRRTKVRGHQMEMRGSFNKNDANKDFLEVDIPARKLTEEKRTMRQVLHWDRWWSCIQESEIQKPSKLKGLEVVLIWCFVMMKREREEKSMKGVCEASGLIDLAGSDSRCQDGREEEGGGGPQVPYRSTHSSRFGLNALFVEPYIGERNPNIVSR